MNWDDLRFVLALSRAGSISAAARALKVDPSTIGRRITALEGALDAQIALRQPDGMRLTDAGEAVARTAERMEALLTELTNDVGGGASTPRGHVRIATTESTASLLYSGLAATRDEYPLITFELVISSAPVDLAKGEADLAVRMFRDTRPDMIVRKVGVMGWSVYAAASYIEKHPVCSCDSFEGHDLIGFAEATARSAGGLWLATREKGARVVMRGTTITTVTQSALVGMGIAVLPVHAADARLTRLTNEVVATTDVFLVIPPTHRDTVRVRIVSDAIASLFALQRASLAG